MEPLDQLENGPIHRFADWPNNGVDRAPGVYSIWKDGLLVYVGMAGRGVKVAEVEVEVEVDDDGNTIPQQTKGLYGRLHTHANGKRSGDQFCIGVCDRFVVPDLTKEDLVHLRIGANRLLDELTKKYIRQHLQYRYALTPTGKAASELENDVKRGALSAGLPMLNPSKARTS